MAPQIPLQGMPRLPNQTCTTGMRPMGNVVRPGIPTAFPQPPSPFSPQAPQSPHDFPQSPASSQSQEHFQRFESSEAFSQGSQTPRSQIVSTPTYATSPRNDVFSQPPGTPRPVFNANNSRSTTHVYAPSRTPDPYISQPATPSPVSNYPSPRSETRSEPQPTEAFSQQPEVNRQLRDLLQRQQFSKKIETHGATWPQGYFLYGLKKLNVSIEYFFLIQMLFFYFRWSKSWRSVTTAIRNRADTVTSTSPTVGKIG